MRISCGIVSDLASALSTQITHYMSDLVPPLIEVLKSTSNDRETKLSAIIALGDMAMTCGAAFTSTYLPETLKILESAAKQSTSVEHF